MKRESPTEGTFIVNSFRPHGESAKKKRDKAKFRADVQLATSMMAQCRFWASWNELLLNATYIAVAHQQTMRRVPPAGQCGKSMKFLKKLWSATS